MPRFSRGFWVISLVQSVLLLPELPPGSFFLFLKQIAFSENTGLVDFMFLTQFPVLCTLFVSWHQRVTCPKVKTVMEDTTQLASTCQEEIGGLPVPSFLD